MAPTRGRGGFRGRGSFRGGRGDFQSRGRGRGRGGRSSRGGRGGGSAKARVEAPLADGQDFHEDSDSDVQSDATIDSGTDSASEEEDARPTSDAYRTLLSSFRQSNAAEDNSGRKRRKLVHSASTQVRESEELEETDEDDQLQGSAGLEGEDGSISQQELAEITDSEDEDSKSELDPFERHFAHPDENMLKTRLEALAKNEWTTVKLAYSSGGRCALQVPGSDGKAPSRHMVRRIQDVKLKPRLVSNAQNILGDFDHIEQSIAPSLFGYQDVLFGARSPKNAGRLRHMTCLHALNHVFKTRDRVIKNNAKLTHAQEDDDVEYRDQGFARPKVLFLLETKQACVRVIDSITELCDFEQQENKKRFLDSFSLPEDKFSDDKPDDFRELFEGNDENEFRIGVKFTRKTMQFYSKFENSDIILASALGLRRAIESRDGKKKDYDFLSSIEVVVMEQADATLMQNWEHAEFVFEHLNLQPKSATGCDFSRVRSWYLDGRSTNVRQTIVLTAYLTPKINTLHNKHMRNVAGRLKYIPDYTSGTIESLSYGIKQTFSRFDSASHISDPDARFKFFNTTVLPQITRLPKPPQGGLGVLVFIPSYLDFVRLRNSLVDSDFSYASISEYTDATDVRKARSHFMSGRHSLLLYTGRAHHFHRYNIRGVKRVVFYGVPENPRFYDEIVGYIGKTLERDEVSKAEASARVCFSKWERLELERVVGSKRVGKMINDKGDVFDFV